MRLLVAGCGFLGAELATRAALKGWAVTGLTRSGEAGFVSLPNGGFQKLEADLSREEDLRNVRKQAGDFDLVVHCASSGRGGAEAYERVFVQGVQALGHVFPDARLVMAGSGSVYGQTEGSWVDETSVTEPAGAGGAVLLRAEREVLAMSDGLVVRLAGLYGPGRCHAAKAFFEGAAFIEEEKDGSGEGKWMNYVHRNDAAEAILHLVESGLSGIFNVADGRPMTQKTWLEGMKRHFGGPEISRKTPDRNRKRGWSNKRIAVGKLLATGWRPRFGSLLESVLADPAVFVPSFESLSDGTLPRRSLGGQTES